MSRRDDVLDAALRVLGEQGLYGLTHRKVDRAGELPEGTTSNHFRTRATLLVGVVEHMVAADFQVWERNDVPRISSPDQLVDAACGFVTWALSDGRARSAAQIALLEAAITNSEASAVLRTARAQIEDGASAVCATVGIDRVGTMVLLDATDAIIFRQLAMPDPRFEIRPYFDALIGGLARG